MQKDNSTLRHKVTDRRRALTWLGGAHAVLETHAGRGVIYERVYQNVATGVAIEKDRERAKGLCQQRDHWTVWEGDCVDLLANGAGADREFDLVDVDPYGSPWPTIDAFFTNDRALPDRMAIVVNDGLRQKIRVGGAGDVKAMADMVLKYGNDLHSVYLEVCRELMQNKVQRCGYGVESFTGYYCGSSQQMTHYVALLSR